MKSSKIDGTAPVQPLDELRRLNERLIHEAESRTTRQRTIPVLKYNPERSRVPDPLSSPGTVTFLVARNGSKDLAVVEEQIRKTGRCEFKLGKRLFQAVHSRPRVSPEYATEIAISQGVLGDIRYGGNTLAEHAFVPVDLEVGVIVCPYTGGRLSLNSFKLVEYVKQGSTDWLDVIAIVNEPQLTAVEKAANRLIPEDQRFGAVGKHLGSGSNALLWVAVGLLVVYEAAQVYEWLAQDNDDDDNVGGAGDDQAADDAGDMDEGHAGDAQAEAGDADDADDQGDADAAVDADADDDADAGDDGDGDDDDGEISRGDFEAVFEATLYGQLVSQQDFERLGPAASVRQLLTIRRDVLTGKKVIGAKKP